MYKVEKWKWLTKKSSKIRLPLDELILLLQNEANLIILIWRAGELKVYEKDPGKIMNGLVVYSVLYCP